jgi:two-component system alkaline phosphatase synthesis response regulator PhoP
MTKILVIAKEKGICDILKRELSIEGLWADTARTDDEIKKAVESSPYELIIRDSSYQGVIKENGGAPILYLCEVVTDHRILDNFDWDHHHFLMKPFRRGEFKDKIHELLDHSRERLIIYKDLKIDLKKHLVVVKDKIIGLGRKEKEILVMLVKKAGQIVYHSDENMGPHLQELKKKLRASVGEAIMITSFYGGGYMLEYRH